MNDNEFFRNFISKYQKGLTRTLEKTLEKTKAESSAAAGPGTSKKKKATGAKSSQPAAANANGKPGKKADFGKMIMDHVSSTNYYRKNLPSIFTGESN